MNKKYITTSLMLAVLAGGKTIQDLYVPETKASINDHLLIWKTITRLSAHSVVIQEGPDELKMP